MTFARVLYCLSLCVASGIIVTSAHSKDVPVFDRGEKYDFEHGDVYKEQDPKKKDQKKDPRNAKAVQKLIKDLKDPDPEIRRTACEMLSILCPADATPALIDVLRPERKETIAISVAAHGALVKITGQNFGYKNYDQWMSWWTKNRQEFLKKAATGIEPNAKIAAEAANTIGMKFMDDGAFSAAQAQFLDAVDKDPTVPDYRNNLGNSLRDQGRYLDAMEYYEETIGINKDLPQPYMNIGICYSRMGKSIEAQSWFKKAIVRDKNGNLWELPWMIGKECMQRAEWNLAFEYLDQARAKAEKKNIHDPRVYLDLALTHYGMDQYHSAWKELMNVKTLGFEPNEGFVEKVRQALIAQGIDPEAEDKKARDTLLGPKADDDEPVTASSTK